MAYADLWSHMIANPDPGSQVPVTILDPLACLFCIEDSTTTPCRASRIRNKEAPEVGGGSILAEWEPKIRRISMLSTSKKWSSACPSKPGIRLGMRNLFDPQLEYPKPGVFIREILWHQHRGHLYLSSHANIENKLWMWKIQKTQHEMQWISAN